MIAEAPAYDLPEMKLELARFLIAAQKRSSGSIGGRRRAGARHYRTWPLAVTMGPHDDEPQFSAALHDASPEGIGFLFNRRLKVGRTLYLKLFGFMDSPMRIPAVVRHVTPHPHGYLVGCEFAVDTDDVYSLLGACVGR